MCTSFIKKTYNNHYIAMNFDNNGMKYSINTRKKEWFIISIDTGKGKYPCFGIHKSGIFFNNILVDANEKGKYRRGKGVVHSTGFLSDIIEKKICIDDLDQYLEQTEIVNVPDWSTHNMICDTKGNTWMVEPGRGNTYCALKADEFQIMTNNSIIENTENGREIPCIRYKKAKELLSEATGMAVNRAFKILDSIKQSEGEWTTVFSMVYDKSKETVYYCENQDFANIQEFLFL